MTNRSIKTRLGASRTLAVGFVGACLAVSALAAPIGHWRFDEASGPSASNSAVGASGTLAGNAAFVAGGVSGNCVTFPTYGGGYVTMGNTYNIDANAEFSISVWTKTTNSTQSLFPVTRHLTGIFNGFIVAINFVGAGYNNPLRPTFYLNDSPSTITKGSTIATDGAWHHIVCVYRFIGTGSIREVWVDGVREGFNANAGPNPHPSPSFMVGGIFSNTAGDSGAFEGQVDDVQVYDYAVSAADVAAMHATPASIAAPKRCFCDLNNDNQRNTADLVVFLGRFGVPATLGSPGDFNYDGAVNTIDLTIFLGRFGLACN